VILQLSVNGGMGQHLKDLSKEQRVVALKWSWAFQLLAITASMLGKLAILAFLVQIRGRHEKKPWFLIVLGVLIGAINIAVLGTILGQCQPMHKLWDDDVVGTCDAGRKLNQNYSFFQASEFAIHFHVRMSSTLLMV
jgi:H+/Cl- antiporter ClcA